MASLDAAKKLRKILNLPNSLEPMRPFGANSKWGKIFETRNGKIMKISRLSNNSNREAKIGTIAGKIGVGPKIHNVRTHAARTITDRELYKNLFSRNNVRKVQILIMNKVNRAMSFYNSINSSSHPINWSAVQNVINRMHAGGIHHGDLHGENILVEYGQDGKPIRAWIIDFGTAVHHKNIVNINSAVSIAIPPSLKSAIPSGGNRSYSTYHVAGVSQPVVKNTYSVGNLKRYAQTSS
jgi:predicted Ser/Thr protein kinase